jgi:hypothetical protein
VILLALLFHPIVTRPILTPLHLTLPYHHPSSPNIITPHPPHPIPHLNVVVPRQGLGRLGLLISAFASCREGVYCLALTSDVIVVQWLTKVSVQLGPNMCPIGQSKQLGMWVLWSLLHSTYVYIYIYIYIYCYSGCLGAACLNRTDCRALCPVPWIWCWHCLVRCTGDCGDEDIETFICIQRSVL